MGKVYSNEYYNINNWNGKVKELCLKNVQSSQKEELLKELDKNELFDSYS